MAANTAPRADAAPTVTRKSRVRWLILLLISVMSMITYLDRANISVTASAMAAEFALSKTETGLIFSAFAWAYALGQIPGGFLADRLGPKRVLLLIVPNGPPSRWAQEPAAPGALRPSTEPVEIQIEHRCRV